MSVLSYLNNRASTAVLSETERTSINTSISTLGLRLDQYFTTDGDKLSKHFRFGSSTRSTILPRSIDPSSDVDYMVVFEKGGLTPQSYIDRLKRFAEKKYSSSEIYQSSPTIVLELNHIRFDLVPALNEYGAFYKIPNGPATWRQSNPNDFNTDLEKLNKDNSYLLKPTIRLAKIWNVTGSNGRVFDSFAFEKWIKDRSFWGCSNQTEYLFTVFDNLSANTDTQWRNDRILRAKELIANIRRYEKEDMPITAESEMKKLIPE